MRRHLMRPDVHREERDAPVWVRSPWCQHGNSRPCAVPGCPAGIVGSGRAVAGPREVVYLVRERYVVQMHGWPVERWRWVEAKRVNLVAEEAG